MSESSFKRDEIPSENLLNKEYGKGFNMMKKMGFKTGLGLGPSGEGIITPIEISVRRPGEGLRDDEALQHRRTRNKPRLRRDETSRSTGNGPHMEDEGSMDESYESSSSFEHGVNMAPAYSEAEQRLLVARKTLNSLLENRRTIEYKLFALAQSSTDVPTVESLDALIEDVVNSNVLSESIHDIGMLSRLVDLLRDKYDACPLWYEIDVEGYIASLVSEAVDQVCENHETSPDLIHAVRDILIDDEAFSRVLEFQLLPPYALIPDFSICKAIMNVASPIHYQSIYSRFLADFLGRSVSKHETARLICENWIDLIPTGRTRERFLLDQVKPRLIIGSSPDEVLLWKGHFTHEDWKDILRRIALQLLSSLKRVEVGSALAFQMVDAAISWADVVSPCVVGFLLIESGFLPKWFEYHKGKNDLNQAITEWFPVLSKVSYHSPAKKVVLDSVRSCRGEGDSTQSARRRPGGPPPEFFSSQAKPVDSQRAGLGDVIRDEANTRNVLITPKPDMRENGCQVFKVGDRTIYWKDESLFERVGDSKWTEIGIDSLFR